ncbi:MAG: hypothetical protein OEV64_00200 [Desulfobulbaceae bacterium]|nr:hypothetical protein [Desulfobulbaceae bacterium]
MTEGSLLNNFIAFSRDQLAVMARVIQRFQESPADFDLLNDLDEAIVNLSNACEYLEKPAIAVTLQNLQAIPIRLRSSGKPLSGNLHRGLLNLHDCLSKLVDHLDSDYRFGAFREDGEPGSVFPEDLPGTIAYYQFIISTRTDFANLLFLLKDLPGAEDQQALLVRCLGILENLHDAAYSVNATGLAEFYLRWSSEVGELLESCVAGNHISPLSLIDFVKKFPEVLTEAADRLIENRQKAGMIYRGSGEKVIEEEQVEVLEAEKVDEDETDFTEAGEQFFIVTGDIRKTLEDVQGYCESLADQQQPRFETIHHCGESIAALRSAFLSCGSRGLAHFCGQWLQKTNKLGFDLKEGKIVDSQFMFDYLEQLFSILPREEMGVEVPVWGVNQPQDSGQVAENDTSNSELFRKLSASVNATMSNIANAELSSFHDILEEMLEGDTDAIDENKYDGDALSAIVDELLEPNHGDD